MIVDHSALSVWRSCKRKFYWNYVLELDAGRSDPMERGSMAHRILYDYYKTGDLELALDAGFFERPAGMLPEEEYKYVELEKYTKQLIRGYVKALGPHDQELSVVEGEVFLAAPIFGKFFYVGVIDQLAELRKIGLFVHEFKTSGQIASDWVAKLQIDQQTTGYVWLGRKNGLDVRGAIISVLRATKYPDYVRDSVVTPDWLLHEFEAELQEEVTNIEEALDYQQRAGYQRAFPKNTNECFSYGHKCPFHKLCAEKPTMREVMLKEGFYPKRKPREADILEKAMARENYNK
jgi:hypothetical protein